MNKKHWQQRGMQDALDGKPFTPPALDIEAGIVYANAYIDSFGDQAAGAMSYLNDPMSYLNDLIPGLIEAAAQAVEIFGEDELEAYAAQHRGDWQQLPLIAGE